MQLLLSVVYCIWSEIGLLGPLFEQVWLMLGWMFLDGALADKVWAQSDICLS